MTLVCFATGLQAAILGMDSERWVILRPTKAKTPAPNTTAVTNMAIKTPCRCTSVGNRENGSVNAPKPNETALAMMRPRMAVAACLSSDEQSATDAPNAPQTIETDKNATTTKSAVLLGSMDVLPITLAEAPTSPTPLEG